MVTVGPDNSIIHTQDR